MLHREYVFVRRDLHRSKLSLINNAGTLIREDSMFRNIEMPHVHLYFQPTGKFMCTMLGTP
jgi:hypothetical protein